MKYSNAFVFHNGIRYTNERIGIADFNMIGVIIYGKPRRGDLRMGTLKSYEKIIKGNCFYIDKTFFIKEWLESADWRAKMNTPISGE